EAALTYHAAVLLARRQHVTDKEQIELAAFGGLRRAPIIVDAGDGGGVHRPMPPGGDMVASRVDEQAQMHLRSHQSAPSLPYWLRGRRSPKCSRSVVPA